MKCYWCVVSHIWQDSSERECKLNVCLRVLPGIPKVGTPERDQGKGDRQ